MRLLSVLVVLAFGCCASAQQKQVVNGPNGPVTVGVEQDTYAWSIVRDQTGRVVRTVANEDLPFYELPPGHVMTRGIDEFGGAATSKKIVTKAPAAKANKSPWPTPTQLKTAPKSPVAIAPMPAVADHHHVCVKCGTAWEHSEDGGSHVCPKCGGRPPAFAGGFLGVPGPKPVKK